MENMTTPKQMKLGKRIGSKASATCQRVNEMAHLRNDQVYSYHVEWEGSLKGRRKGWFVRLDPLPSEKTGGFGFGGRGVRYGERFDDWEVFVVIVSSRESA
jgi:hypothetical protein